VWDFVDYTNVPSWLYIYPAIYNSATQGYDTKIFWVNSLSFTGTINLQISVTSVYYSNVKAIISLWIYPTTS
jgi:hypothetical protein